MKTILCLWFCLLVSTAGFSQGYLEQFPLRQQTRYFDFRFKGNPDKIKAIARFADAFVSIVNRDFFKADFDYPIRVLVLEDREKFQKLLREQFAISDPPNFGIFLSRYNLFATYQDSGLGTFAHEIMHPLVERNLKDRPIWALEGIPTFFEKFYGHWENDEMVIHWGFQNPWRIDMLGTNLTQLDLKEIVSTTQSPGDYRESDRRLVSMFLWEQGRFKQFLQLIKRREKSGYDSYFEAAMGMPLHQMIPLWKDYLNKVALRRSEIIRFPPSAILPDEPIFNKFVAFYGIPIVEPLKISKSETNSPTESVKK